MTRPSGRARQCRQKFLDFFPEGFRDPVYVETERTYKWDAHKQWAAELGRDRAAVLGRGGEYEALAREAVRIESRTNLLFSFEKMALRDAISTPGGAKGFGDGLATWLYGKGSERDRFEHWCAAVGDLPRRQTRVLTWPIVTVFGFIARPRMHIVLKPNVTRRAAAAYGFDFHYASKPHWDTYASLLDFTRVVRNDLSDLQPRDMIDIQSFLWVQGSEEYE